MKDTLGRPAVAVRVVQNALRDTIRTQERRGEAGRVRRQRHYPSQSRAVEYQSSRGQPRDTRNNRRANAVEIVVEEGLNPGVGWTQMVAQQAVLGFVAAQQWVRDLEEAGLRRAVPGRLTERSQLEVQVPDQFGGRRLLRRQGRHSSTSPGSTLLGTNVVGKLRGGGASWALGLRLAQEPL